MSAEAAPEDLAGVAGGVEIDFDAVVANHRLLARLAAPAACAAAVKADAYGLGLEPVARALHAAGCAAFFVAQLAEGARLRGIVPGATIYVLNGLAPGTAAAYARHGLRPVLGSAEEATEWVAAAGREAPAALHVDTGMNRLGASLPEAAALARGETEAGSFAPALVMSHFVRSEAPEDPVNARQIALFGEARGLFPGVPGSLANSSGVFLGGSAHHDLVRPGYALYGGNPTPGRPNPMRAAARVTARVAQVRRAEAGERVGYEGRWTARRPSRLVTIQAGYADGYPRAAGGLDAEPRGEAVLNGARVPVVGRVSMDLAVLDATDAPGEVRRGDLATLLGDGIGVDDLAAWSGTNGYEVLTRLGRRHARAWVGGG